MFVEAFQINKKNQHCKKKVEDRSQKMKNIKCLNVFKRSFILIISQFSSVQSLSHVQLFATPWITECQASLSITNSRSSLKLTSIQWCRPAISSSVIPFSSCPQSLPASDLLQGVNSSHEVAKVLEFQL